ncbi:MAG: hypothetical protein HeimC3_10840 [Candidatus Heimdallarchaeota archaeon LC_3]|nr:MAG: hypothetical protein HeimC3_10840 [Candidatus Heimdallarchaeota archaeon LC_3]
MSPGLEEIILERKKAFYIQNLIENHKIGRILAEKSLGIIPNFFVINNIKKSYFDGRNGILLLEIEYNSELGAFQNLIAYKEFPSNEDAQYNISLHNWVKKRIKINPRVHVPDIYASDKNYIIFEGIKGQTFNIFNMNPIKQARMAGEVLATYHSAETHPADILRYSKLLDEAVNNLPISSDRKERLLSLGYTLLINYDNSKSGIYAYGDFHPENVIISSEGNQGYLIDPEFIEMNKEADRYEDIANFFVFSAINEFKEKDNIDKTIKSLEAFLGGYNSYLENSGQNLKNIYGTDQQLVELFFHLGLIALIKGVFTSKTLITVKRDISEAELNEILSIYKFVSTLWKYGLKFVPEDAFPQSFHNKRINEENRVLSWVGIGRMVLNYFQKDDHFHILSMNSGTSQETVEGIFRIGKIQSKKELEKRIKVINSWFQKKLVEIKKDKIIINDDFISNFHFPNYLSDWQNITKKLINIYRLKPEYNILFELITNPLFDIKKIQKKLDLNQKETNEIIEQLVYQGIALKTDHTISFNPNWQNLVDNTTRAFLLSNLA